MGSGLRFLDSSRTKALLLIKSIERPRSKTMRFRRLIASLVLATTWCAMNVHAADCTGVPAGCTEVSLTVDGRSRIYQYHLPQGSSCATTSLPVVLFLHGGNGTASAIRQALGYGSSDRNCFIYVFPEGARGAGGGVWNSGDCLGLPQGSGYTGSSTSPGCGYGLEQAGVSDVRYVRALLDDLKQRTDFDARRVYASGWSLGGGMTHRLACELSDRITAIAPIEGTMKIPPCAPPRAVPMMEWGSLGDTTSPFGGGPGDTSVPYSVAVRLAACDLPTFANPTTTFVVPSVLSAAITDSVKQWSGGRNGCRVILHTLSSQLPHDWFLADPVAFDWQETNWSFFKEYALPVGPTRRRAIHH
jgi:polyhydroxybutyrate depolymerase